jgi:adenosine/AMP kinase
MIAGRLLGLKRLVARLAFEFRCPMVQHRHVLIRRRLSGKVAVASLAMESIIAIRASVVFVVHMLRACPISVEDGVTGVAFWPRMV